MNYIFVDDRCTNTWSDTFLSDYTLEYLSIDDKALNPLDKAMQEFNGWKLPMLNSSWPWNWAWFFCKKNTGESVTCKNDSSIDFQLESQDSSNCNSLTSNSIISKEFKNVACKITDSQVNDDSIQKEYYLTKFTTNKNYELESQRQEPTLKNQIQKLDECEVLYDDNNSKTDSKPKRNRISGYRRWNNVDDWKMFTQLRKACKEQNIDIEEYWTKEYPISKQHESILIEIAYNLDWKRDILTLIKRIKMLVKDQSMSVRQNNLIRKLFRESQKKNIELDFESIMDSFPGKSIETLKSRVKKLTSINKH